MYYRDTDAAIITFDVGDEKSFKEVSYWVEELRNKCEYENLIMALVGNKCDIEPEKKRVSLQMAKDLANQNEMIFHECSAKTGEGVQELFKKLAELSAKKKRPE